MLKVAALLAALGFPAAVFAFDTHCPVYPIAEWIKEPDARAQIEAQGYRIAKFEIDDNCYEVDAYNKDGRQVELHYDTKTLAVVRQSMK
jgi:hypothetical protein